MIVIKDALETDLPGILQLQKLNLKQSLGISEINKEGFVTLQHSLRTLQHMNFPYPHTIAVFENQVVGYALTMIPEMVLLVPDLKPMFDMLAIESYVVMGQICIDKAHRQRGIFRSMYEYMIVKFHGKYEYIITEIAIENTRSILAHKHIGFIEMAVRPEWSIVGMKI